MEGSVMRQSMLLRVPELKALEVEIVRLSKEVVE
jgi:hypothetical protein